MKTFAIVFTSYIEFNDFVERHGKKLDFEVVDVKLKITSWGVTSGYLSERYAVLYKANEPLQ